MKADRRGSVRARAVPLAAQFALSLIAGGFAPAQARPADEAVFRRGINITRLFDSPQRQGSGYADPAFLPWTHEISPAELARLRATGFDFIRLPIDPGPFLAEDDAHALRDLAPVFDFLHTAMRDGFGVIVDLHPRPGGEWSPHAILDAVYGPKFTRYEAFASELAARLEAERTNHVLLELMNEPQSPCARNDGTDWTTNQQHLYAAVRRTAPSLGLVVTGGCFSSIDGLQYLDLHQLADSHLYAMIHFYEPFVFTHQGASWSPYSKYLAGLRYPVDAADRDAAEAATRNWLSRPALASDDSAAQKAESQLNTYFAHPLNADAIGARFDVAAHWADAMGLPRARVIVGEFGVMDEGGGLGTGQADRAARAAWLRDVSHAATARGFGWAVWGYHGGFGIVSDDAQRRLDPDVVSALFAR